MKYCPNTDCPYARKFSKAGEYQDTASACSDCGATLVVESPAVVKPTAEAPRVVKPSDANTRLAVTIGASAALAVLSWLPVFGAPQSLFGGDDRAPPLKMLAVGLVPFMTAFNLTELLALLLPPMRAVRTGGAQARATLDRVSWGLGLLFLAAQLYGVVRYAAATDTPLPPTPLLWGQFALAHGVMLGLALVVSRAGLSNGLGLVMVMALVQTLAANAQPVVGAVLSDSVSLGSVVLFGGAVLFVAMRGVRFARQSRGAAGPLPTAAPFPVSGAVAWLTAAAVMSLPATLGAWWPEAFQLQRALQRSAMLYNLLSAFLAFDLTLLFGFLFFRPRAIGAIWKRWQPGIDETGVISAARALLPRAMALAIGLTVAVPLGFVLMGNLLNLWIGGATVLFTMTIGCALADIVDEWHALRRLGPLVSVWEVQRTAEVEPIASLLGTAGIEVHARSFLLRTTQQFFAPWIPVSILVPVAREAEAKALLAKS